MQDDLIPAAGNGHWNDPDMVSGISLQSMPYSLSFEDQKLESPPCIDNLLSS